MNWIAEIDAIRAVARSASPDELPRLYGDLQSVAAEVLAKTLGAAAQSQKPDPDELLDVNEAARRLGISAKYLYTHSFPFKRQIGRRTLYLASGIDAFIRRKCANGANGLLTPRRQCPIVPPRGVSQRPPQEENNEGKERRRRTD